MFFRLSKFRKKMRSPYFPRLMETCTIPYRGKREGDEKNIVKSNTFISILRPYSRPLSVFVPCAAMPRRIPLFGHRSKEGIGGISLPRHVSVIGCQHAEGARRILGPLYEGIQDLTSFPQWGSRRRTPPHHPFPLGVTFCCCS